MNVKSKSINTQIQDIKSLIQNKRLKLLLMDLISLPTMDKVYNLNPAILQNVGGSTHMLTCG